MSSQDERIMVLSSMHTGDQPWRTQEGLGAPLQTIICGLLCRNGAKGTRGAFPFILTFSCGLYAAFTILKTHFRTGEMAQQLRVSIALTEEPQFNSQHPLLASSNLL